MIASKDSIDKKSPLIVKSHDVQLDADGSSVTNSWRMKQLCLFYTEESEKLARPVREMPNSKLYQSGRELTSIKLPQFVREICNKKLQQPVREINEYKLAQLSE